MLQKQSWGVVTETVRPVKPKIGFDPLVDCEIDLMGCDGFKK